MLYILVRQAEVQPLQAHSMTYAYNILYIYIYIYNACISSCDRPRFSRSSPLCISSRDSFPLLCVRVRARAFR